MTGKQLKNSILQLAIQGKLVPQDPHDEPASELLKRIRKEKEQLVKTGKLKKKDLESTPIAEEDKPFEIPETWEWVRISDIMQVKGGKRVPLGMSWQETPTDHIYIRVTDMKNGTIVDHNLRYISDEIFDKIKTYTISKDDLYITVAGTIGSVGIVPDKFDGMNLTENANKLTNISIDKEYIVACFSSPYLQDQFRAMTKQMAQPKLSIRSILEILFPLPPLSEQHRIVEKIEDLMPLVEEYDKAQSELDKLNESLPEQLKKSILQQAIMGKLVPQDPNDEPASELLKRIHKEKENLVKFGALKKKDLITTPISDDEKPFDIPESWEWVRWGALSYSIQYGYNASAEPCGDIRIVRISDIQSNKVLWDTVPYCKINEEDIPNYTLEANDILFARTGGTVGKSFLVEKVPYPAIYAGYLIRTRFSKNLDAKFLKLFMESDLYWDQLHNGTIATAQPNCNGQTLSKMILPLPPLSEQHRIVAKIEELFSILK